MSVGKPKNMHLNEIQAKEKAMIAQSLEQIKQMEGIIKQCDLDLETIALKNANINSQINLLLHEVKINQNQGKAVEAKKEEAKNHIEKLRKVSILKN